jgi:ribosomal protection tetracycline resistance protein
LGILAHVDAGKTTLTERLLHAAGVIDEIGSVDDGTTQTDSLALEQQRGITIKSAVVSFAIGDITVNLLDTPGHPDFIAEVERVLSVLDGAVLVVSAVEGVQSQTPLLMRALQRLQVPTLIFVNKIDRQSASDERVLQALSDRLSPSVVPMGRVRGIGTRAAEFTPWKGSDLAAAAQLASVLAEHDETVLAAYVDDEVGVPYRRLCKTLAVQSARALVHPVFFGSAVTGAGVDSLMAGIAGYLPAVEGDADGPVSGTVFKIERGPSGDRVAYVRLFSGTVRVRDRVVLGRHDEGKVTAVSVFDHGSAVRSSSVTARQIAKVWGLGDVQIGDSVGTPRVRGEHHFAPPTLETVVVSRRPADMGALHVALSQLAEQDPLIDLRQDDTRQELYVSLYGEVQKEVIEATLANDFGIEVAFRETTTICVERPVGTGAAVEVLGEAPNPFHATVGLRLQPAPLGSGLELSLEVELGSMPIAFFRAVEETVRSTLRQGLFGWQVIDSSVAITHSGYSAPSSTAGDFRKLTPLVLIAALEKASTVVCEPIHRFHLVTPSDALGSVLSALARLRAVPDTQEIDGALCTLEGEIPAGRVHQLQRELPALTRGEGVLESEFGRYCPVSGDFPTRPRSDHNPLNREEYLLRVTRRGRLG